MVSTKTSVKYKVVRRGQKWAVRVRGAINTDNAWHWCRERNMTYHIKRHYSAPYSWEDAIAYDKRWDYTFIFDKEYESTAFIIGFI